MLNDVFNEISEKFKMLPKGLLHFKLSLQYFY